MNCAESTKMEKHGMPTLWWSRWVCEDHRDKPWATRASAPKPATAAERACRAPRALKKLAAFRLDAPRLQFDVLLPGHGAIAMDKAYMDVQKARDTVESDLAAGREVEGSPYSTPLY